MTKIISTLTLPFIVECQCNETLYLLDLET